MPPPEAAKPVRRPGPLLPGGWLVILVLAAVAFALFLIPSRRALTFTEFERLVEAGQLKKLTLVGKERAVGEARDKDGELAKELKLTGGQFSVHLPPSDNAYDLIRRLQKTDADDRARRKAATPADDTPPLVIDPQDDPSPLYGQFALVLLPLAVFVAFFVIVVLPRLKDPVGGGFLNSYVRSPARRYEKGRGRLTFDDVAGMEGCKRELTEVVEFLRDPDKFARLGAQVPKGVLLVGPPGTGKTLLAKAVAGEANVPFYSINGSEFIQMFVGVGASRVRDLFRTAKDAAPCVIFIDEIDAVGRMRGTGLGGGSDEREQTLNQILSEMDGFAPQETVIVLAATNRPDVLDTALLRPGRFDRHITVDRPTWQGRLAILKVHTRNKPLADTVDLERVARAMIGMSGAELRNLCNEAALVATRLGKNVLEQSDFDAAADRVRLGAKREDQFPEGEKKRTAYHEAGHALVAWMEPHCDPLVRVSIVPRGQTGGVAMVQPDEDQVSQGQAQLSAMMVLAMGGRAADKLVYGEPRTGELMDLKMATRVARAMVTQYGMSEALGPVHYKAGEEHHFLGKEITEERDHSEDTTRLIDQEVRRLLTEAERRAIDLLRTNRDKLDVLANALLHHEELDRVDVEQVLKGVPIPDLRKSRGLAPGKAPPPAADVAIEPPALPGGLALGGV